MSQGLIGDDLAATSCPRCGAGVEATWSRRVIPVGGRWKEQGDPWWSVRCANAHSATGQTLQGAVDALAGPRRR